MSRNRAVVVVALVAMLLGVGGAWAQSRARVWGIVTDEAGQPLGDVKITILDPEEQVRGEQMTNKKGRYTVALLDATLPYLFRFEKDGYKILEEPIKVSILSNTRRDFTLEAGRGMSVPAAAAGGEAQPPVTGGATGIYNEGVRAFEENDFETARAKFEEAITKDPKLGIGYSALARALFRMESFEGAAQRAQEALEFNKDDQVALSVLYQSYKKLGEEERAKEIYDHLLELSDPDVAAFNLGVEAYQSGDMEAAKQKFNEALEHNPELFQAYAGLARIYAAEKAWPEAAAAADKTLALDPENEGALTARYEAALGMGDEAAAEKALEGLKKVAPERLARNFYDHGVQLFNESELVEARQAFEQVLALDPHHARAHYMLALVLVNAGDSVAAKEHLNRFLELTPDDPDAGTAREMIKYLE